MEESVIGLHHLAFNVHTQWYPEALFNRTRRRNQRDIKSTKIRRIIKDMHRMVPWKVELKCSALE